MRNDPNALATFQAVLHVITGHLPDRTTAVTDLGCSDGQLLSILHGEGYRNLTGVGFHVSAPPPIKTVTGVDLSVPGWAAQLPGKQSLALATDVIEHLCNPLGFLNECSHILEPGGLLLLTFPNVHNLRSRIAYMLTGRFSGFFGPNMRPEMELYDQHIWIPNRHLLRYFLEKSGFETLHVGYVHGPGVFFSQTTLLLARSVGVPETVVHP
ncbi:MAG: methyltransferase domain-containing protein [Verrucomicrobiae bacterium]|nr:methyltransferase domain-containing protein [Verrucomicrobiae bacterium]